MPDQLWHIKHCQMFQRLTPNEIGRLESHSRTRTYPAGSAIYLPSERADAVYLVADGVVKVSSLSPDGKESILAFIDQGELFGELALIDAGPREEFVEAVTRCSIVMIPADTVRQLLSQRSDLALAVTKLVGLRRQRIERRLRNLLFQSSRERLTHLLLDLEEQFGSETNEGVLIRLKLSHQDLANLIGTTRETVTGILGDLRNEKLIEARRCKITLINPARMAKSVHRVRQRNTTTTVESPFLRSALAMI